MGKEFLNKSVYGRLQKSIDKTDKDTIIVRGYFTSDARDEAGDIITRAATERAIPKYKNWMNVRFMHQPKPVAKVLKIGTQDGLEWNEVEIEVVDSETIRMVEFGLLTALSVGILVNYEDVDFLEDGGLIINNYQLAEISLVDHPANYDAKLKDIVLDREARVFALQYGLDALRAHLGGEMAKKKELVTEENEVTKDIEVAEETQEPTEEVQEVEKSIEVEPADEQSVEEIEKDIETEPVEELPAAEVETQEEVEAVEEKSIEEEISEPEETIEKYTESDEPDALTAAIAELTSIARSMSETASVLASVVEKFIQPQEAPAPEAVSVDEGNTIDSTEDVEEVEEEKDVVVAERKGKMPSVAVEEDSPEKEAVQKTTDLRQALRKRFGLVE